MLNIMSNVIDQITRGRRRREVNKSDQVNDGIQTCQKIDSETFDSISKIFHKRS